MRGEADGAGLPLLANGEGRIAVRGVGDDSDHFTDGVVFGCCVGDDARSDWQLHRQDLAFRLRCDFVSNLQFKWGPGVIAEIEFDLLFSGMSRGQRGENGDSEAGSEGSANFHNFSSSVLVAPVWQRAMLSIALLLEHQLLHVIRHCVARVPGYAMHRVALADGCDEMTRQRDESRQTIGFCEAECEEKMTAAVRFRA
jgi:hypothetical protein